MGRFSQIIINPPIAINKIEKPSNQGKSKKIECPIYNSNNQTAIDIIEYLQTNNHMAIEKAIVVGSIADNSATNYSDFDGILIIDKNKCVSSKEVKKLRNIIKESNTMMKKQDRLQHHGWMILWKHELNNYNENYLPSSIFNDAKTLFTLSTNIIELQINNSIFDDINLQNICKSILKKINNKKQLKKIYFFKNLISEILLTPALFLQSKKNINCSKKESFTLIKNHISLENIDVLKTIELFRNNWNQNTNNKKNATPITYINWFALNKENILNYLKEINR